MSVENPGEAIFKPITILHINNNLGFLDPSKTFLKKKYNQIDMATEIGPTEGLERIEDEGFHCVVSDYEMPTIDERELLAEGREECLELPFVLYTGTGSEEIAAKAINAGVTGYFQKGSLDQHRRLATNVSGSSFGTVAEAKTTAGEITGQQTTVLQ